MSIGLTERVKALAQEVGFDRAAISDAQPLHEAERRIKASIAAGYLDGLHWFTTERAQRATHPTELMPGARSILVLSASYLARVPPPEPVPGRPRGRIARYAWGADYHDVLRDMARALVERLPAVAGRRMQSRIFVDSSPLAERPVAQRAGLGWFGKNTNILLPGAGSWSSWRPSSSTSTWSRINRYARPAAHAHSASRPVLRMPYPLPTCSTAPGASLF